MHIFEGTNSYTIQLFFACHALAVKISQFWPHRLWVKFCRIEKYALQSVHGGLYCVLSGLRHYANYTLLHYTAICMVAIRVWNWYPGTRSITCSGTRFRNSEIPANPIPSSIISIEDDVIFNLLNYLITVWNNTIWSVHGFMTACPPASKDAAVPVSESCYYRSRNPVRDCSSIYDVLFSLRL